MSINEDKNKDSSATKVTNPKFSDPNAPRVGGVTNLVGPNEPHDVFDTKDNQPVRDKKPDTSKGTPIKRFFTKDGTPVEPTTVPTGVTPAHLAEPQASERDDVIEVWEYLDEGNNVVTHDALKREQESKKPQSDK